MVFRNFLQSILSEHPINPCVRLLGGHLGYSVAESLEKRSITPKLAELRRRYRLPFSERYRLAQQQLTDFVVFAGQSVPYYRDLFRELGISADKLRSDIRYLNDIPFLTKDIIREQGDRMLSAPLAEVRHHERKTGGSTGLSCMLYYDQEGLDYSAAVTSFARQSIGKYRHRSELHFACRFPDAVPEKWPSREDFKCFAMNRSNIFFDRIDDHGLEEIWQTLKHRRPYLVHGHPSTIYALARYVERRYGTGKAFNVFESSGELMEQYQRDTISRVLECRVVDRYGLAELGVMAYEVEGAGKGLRVFESEGWPESIPVESGGVVVPELVFTGFRNRLMPLIRYRTGDLATVERRETGFYLTNIVGRIHDLVPINGVDHATHHIQDMLDHRVGGIQEFQIDLRTTPPTLKIVPEHDASPENIRARVEQFWGAGFNVKFCRHDDFVRVGRHAKFRHVVHP